MPPETKVLYEFGRFRCDPREHLLLCEGKPVSLSPKSFDILLALIQNNGRLVTKDELMHQVWPDSFVEEGNLTVNISALRRALGALPQGQQYIETVPKKGYRFVAAVTQLRDDGKTAAQIPAVEEPSALPKIAPASAPAARPRRWWPMAALPLVAVMVIVLVSSRPARLTDKDTVVLADFSNTTGDPVFDGALRQGLSSQLEQSPFLNLLSDERIAQTLSLMAQPKDSRLNQELSREICQRTASAAVLNGAIAQVGTQYLLTLKAINCSNGESLGSAEEQATDKNHVLDALGKVAAKMRNRLGESLTSVEKYDAPAENVTTPSLEALKAYSLGCQAMAVKSDYSASIPLFQRAISLDRNFAMAYARMGTSYDDLNETVRATEVMRRAYELRKRVSEREEFYIAEHYEILVTGNLEAARKVDELSALTYPRNTPFSNLGFIYSELGDYDKALAAFQNALKLDPETGNRYAPLVSGYLQLNRLDEAKATGREAERHNIDYPEVHLNLYWVNFLQHDAAGMEREAAGMMGRPGHEDQMLNYEADTAAYGGQIAKAHELTQRAVEAARKVDEKEAPALYLANAAVREALLGNSSMAKQQAQAALAISNSRDAEALSAIALGLTDNSMQATRLADDLARRFPQDTIVQFNYLPSIRAATLLQTKNYLKAVEILEKAAPYELGGNIQTLNFVLYPVYLRGEAYLAMKQGAAAAAEFQKIINHPGVVRSEPIGALARLELGRVLVVAGDQAKAKANYQEFFTLWENADPDTPLLRQARTEYARLQ
jgi:DNA-binding winged helix-turn-helix (wHTH) protein/tetratricopeptide (TPR) repeat protein